MGFFSWKTQDTLRSIANQYSNRKTFHVTMTDDKGNKYHENNYEGYGVFGGKDYYVLLAEMNGIVDTDEDNLRSKGIDLAFDENHNLKIKYPNLTENKNHVWIDDEPEHCECQGYFYYDADDDDDYYDEE